MWLLNQPARNFQPNAHLGLREPTEACRKKRYKQSFYNVERLRRGKIPYGYSRWPNGLEADRVLLPLPLVANSFDVNTRLDVPKAAHLVTSQQGPLRKSASWLTQGSDIVPFYDHYHLGLVV